MHVFSKPQKQQRKSDIFDELPHYDDDHQRESMLRQYVQKIVRAEVAKLMTDPVF